MTPVRLPLKLLLPADNALSGSDFSATLTTSGVLKPNPEHSPSTTQIHCASVHNCVNIANKWQHNAHDIPMIKAGLLLLLRKSDHGADFRCMPSLRAIS